MSGTTLAGALVGHLVGDYVLQNDWMALHKKQSLFRCAVHCALWTFAVCALSGWWSAPFLVLILFVTHFAQDHTNGVAWWMDHVGQRQFRTGPCAPWSGIVVDNVLHIMTIYAVWRWIA